MSKNVTYSPADCFLYHASDIFLCQIQIFFFQWSHILMDKNKEDGPPLAGGVLLLYLPENNCLPMTYKFRLVLVIVILLNPVAFLMHLSDKCLAMELISHSLSSSSVNIEMLMPNLVQHFGIYFGG